MNSATNPYAPTTDTNADVAAEWLDAPQSVQYCFSAELLAAYWTHRTLTSPSDNRLRRRAAWTLMLIGLVPGLIIVALAVNDLLSYWFAIPLLLLPLMSIFTGYNSRKPSAIQATNAQTARRLIDESPNTHVLSERTVTLEATGIRQTMPASESITLWTAYERIDHDDDYLFLYESSYSAVVIPRAAFATRGQFLGFVNLAERLRENSKADGSSDANSPT